MEDPDDFSGDFTVGQDEFVLNPKIIAVEAIILLALSVFR
jgi:hypothetical protein